MSAYYLFFFFFWMGLSLKLFDVGICHSCSLNPTTAMRAIQHSSVLLFCTWRTTILQAQLHLITICLWDECITGLHFHLKLTAFFYECIRVFYKQHKRSWPASKVLCGNLKKEKIQDFSLYIYICTIIFFNFFLVSVKACQRVMTEEVTSDNYGLPQRLVLWELKEVAASRR